MNEKVKGWCVYSLVWLFICRVGLVVDFVAAMLVGSALDLYSHRVYFKIVYARVLSSYCVAPQQCKRLLYIWRLR